MHSLHVYLAGGMSSSSVWDEFSSNQGRFKICVNAHQKRIKAKSFTGTFTMSVKWQVIRKDNFFIISCFSRPFTKNEGWRVKGISYPLIPKKIFKSPLFQNLFKSHFIYLCEFSKYMYDDLAISIHLTAC